MLTNGVEDPKVLKEIREFLGDNEVYEKNIVDTPKDVESSIELPDDFMDNVKWVANG
jgi:hypothetical protein